MADIKQPHKIEVVIDKDGNVHAEVKGVEGSVCELISAFLKDMGTVTEDRKTPDYQKVTKQTVKVK